MDQFGKFTRGVNNFCSSPAATAAAFLIIVVWAICGPVFKYSDGWQLVINTGTTIVTFLMVFVLNNAQSRDTAAVNAKLDALIVAIEKADNRAVGLELKAESDARAISNEIAARAGAQPKSAGA
jgi:low affinity Fe/Cu permease